MKVPATPEQIEIAAAYLAQACRADLDAMRHAHRALEYAGISFWTKCNVDVQRGWDGDDRFHVVQDGYDIGVLAREMVGALMPRKPKAEPSLFGTCPSCRKPVAVRKDGALRAHGCTIGILYPTDEPAPKAEPSQHGGYRVGVPGGQGARLNLEITPTDLALIKEAAEAEGMRTSAWVRSVLIPEAVRVLEKKRHETDE